jgi:hypothetical protein
MSAADSIANFTRALWARTTAQSANGAASDSTPASSFEIILRRTSYDGLSTGAKAGIWVGVALGVIFATTLICWCFLLRRRHRYADGHRYADRHHYADRLEQRRYPKPEWAHLPPECTHLTPHTAGTPLAAQRVDETWSMPVNEWRFNTPSPQPKPVCSQAGISESKTSSNI